MSLDLIYPQGVEVKVGDTALTIKKFTLVQLPAALRLSRPIVNAFLTSGFMSLEGEKIAVSADWPLVMVDLIAENGEYMIEFVRFVVGKTEETPENSAFINALDIDDGLEIIRAAIKVNWDFIKARIMPMVNARVAPQPGSTPSTPSSPQDMQEAT